MRYLRFLTFLLILFVSIPGLAQQKIAPAAPTKPIRDPQALTVIQAALTALGGTTAIGQPQSWQIQGQVQGTDPAGKSVSGTITWEMAGAEFRMAASTNKGSQYIVTGHGSPAAVSGNNTFKIPAYAIRAQFVPALVGSMLLNEFQNTQYNILYLGTKSLGTEPVSIIRTSIASKDLDARVTRQIWYFDKTSGLPVRLEYRLPSQSSAQLSVAGAVTLTNFQPVSGAMYPFQITTYYKDRQASTITLQSVTLNSSIASSDFDPPVSAQ